VIDAEEITANYKAVLMSFMRGRGEGALVQAYGLGRSALAAGLGVLEVAAIHHAAVAEVLRLHDANLPVEQLLEASQGCLVELLAPYEITYRGSREAIAALHHFNDRLESEIKRMAHTLHGETGQLLAAIHLAVGELQRTIGHDVGHGLRQIETLVNDVGQQLRRLSHELRPTVLDDLGLIPAIEFLRDGVATRTGLVIDVIGDADERFPQTIETAMYRVVQEALNNVVKHAEAATVTVRVEHDEGSLVCSIEDDGKGFVIKSDDIIASERGFGLMGMRERMKHLGGSLIVESEPGAGTKITAIVPLSS